LSGEESEDDVSIEDFEHRYGDYTPETQHSLFRMDHELLNVDLLVMLLRHIDASDDRGGGQESAAQGGNLETGNKKNSRGRNRKKGGGKDDNTSNKSKNGKNGKSGGSGGGNDGGADAGGKAGGNSGADNATPSSEMAAGAVLVFLSGIDDITELHTELMSDPHFGQESCFDILVLHSMLSSLEQSKVFARPPAGVRKIILCTNIAGTLCS
jgi:hypothetical protein